MYVSINYIYICICAKNLYDKAKISKTEQKSKNKTKKQKQNKKATFLMAFSLNFFSVCPEKLLCRNGCNLPCSHSLFFCDENSISYLSSYSYHSKFASLLDWNYDIGMAFMCLYSLCFLKITNVS